MPSKITPDFLKILTAFLQLQLRVRPRRILLLKLQREKQIFVALLMQLFLSL